jgi:hypothetical protein
MLLALSLPFRARLAVLDSEDFEATFWQPLPLLVKVPVPKAAFFVRVIALISAIGLCDVLCLGAYLFRRVRARRRAPPRGIASRDFDLDSTYSALR